MSYNTYENYKDSGIEWIGQIPAHWKIIKSKSIFKRYNIQSTTGKEELLSVSEYYGVKPKKDTISEGDFLTHADSLIGYKKCFKNDLVMNIMLAWKKGLGITNYDGIVSPAYEVFKTNQEIAVPKFMHYLLRTKLYTNEFKKHSYGIIDSRLRLYPDNFKVIPFIIPTIIEQQIISNYLDKKIDEINIYIAKNKELISLLEEKKAALINQVVTKGLNTNVPMKDSGIEWIGQIPKHWEIRKMKNLIFFQEGPGLRNWQFTDEGIRVICVTNITEKGIDFSNYEKFISKEEYKQIYQHFTVNKGDLLLSSSGNSWGKVAEYIDDEIVILNTSTIRINENKKLGNVLNQSFIKWSLQSEAVREQLGLMMTGSCQPNFGPTHLAKVLLTYPPSKKEQKEISDYLDKKINEINNIVEKVEDGIKLLEEYKTSLIHNAVTGKIDVRDEV